MCLSKAEIQQAPVYLRTAGTMSHQSLLEAPGGRAGHPGHGHARSPERKTNLGAGPNFSHSHAGPSPPALARALSPSASLGVPRPACAAFTQPACLSACRGACRPTPSDSPPPPRRTTTSGFSCACTRGALGVRRSVFVRQASPELTIALGAGPCSRTSPLLNHATQAVFSVISIEGS